MKMKFLKRHKSETETIINSETKIPLHLQVKFSLSSVINVRLHLFKKLWHLNFYTIMPLQLNFINTDSDNTDSRFTRTNFLALPEVLGFRYICWRITWTQLTRTFS